jgi:hypothetical protein
MELIKLVREELYAPLCVEQVIKEHTAALLERLRKSKMDEMSDVQQVAFQKRVSALQTELEHVDCELQQHVDRMRCNIDAAEDVLKSCADNQDSRRIATSLSNFQKIALRADYLQPAIESKLSLGM